MRKTFPHKNGYSNVLLVSKMQSNDWGQAYMQKTCDVAGKAILAKINLRKKCVNRDKM